MGFTTYKLQLTCSHKQPCMFDDSYVLLKDLRDFVHSRRVQWEEMRAVLMKF